MKIISRAILLLFLTACASTLPQIHPTVNDSEDSSKKVSFDNTQGRTLWSEKTSSEILSAVKEYETRKKLSNGLIYGAVASEFSLAGKSLRDVEAFMATAPCKKLEDFLRDPETKEPKLCNGAKVPQIIYDCRDGSMLRLKPKGDPCSKFRPQAHAVKAVRYPFDADSRDFSKEAFKVDNAGNALPKTPDMLNSLFNADEWGDRVHTNL